MAIVYANDDQIHSIDAALLKFALKVIDKDKIQKICLCSDDRLCNSLAAQIFRY